MQEESKFGKQVFQDGSKTSQVAVRKCLYLLPAVFLFALSLIMRLHPAMIGESTESSGMITVILLVAAPLYALMILSIVKGFSATIYEQGFVLKRGSKVTELAFAEVKGISLANKTLTIQGLDGKNIVLAGMFTPNMKQFAEEFETAYTKSSLYDITQESLYQTNISFGKHLELVNGVFIYKGKEAVTLDDVYGIEVDEETLLRAAAQEAAFIRLKGQIGNDLLTVPLMYVQNLDILRRIIHIHTAGSGDVS